MIPSLLPGGIQIRAEPELRLRSGDLVTLQVIKRILGNKWAVGLGGRVIPAYSDLDLIPGKFLTALVSRQGDRYLLRLSGAQENPLQELLQGQGLETDKPTQLIVTALLRSGISLKAQTVSQIKRLLAKLNKKPQRFARLVTLLLDKKIDLSSPGVPRLIQILGYGEGGPDRRHRRQPPRRQPPRYGETSAKAAGESSNESSAASAEKAAAEILEIGQNLEDPLPGGEPVSRGSVSVFNHLQGGKEHWTIIPYRYAELCGTIRLLHDPDSSRLRRLVLVVGEEGAATWYFHLNNHPRAKELRIFRDGLPASPAIRQGLADLGRKLQNLGVKCDDTIHEAEDFDGFSPPGEGPGYRSIDTLG